MKIIFIFSCSGMFRNVPACSGMFHVPGFIDAPGYRHSVRPVGLPQFFPRVARCIGHINIFSPCWAVLPKYPARCKVSSLSAIFSFVKKHRLE